jgi:putative FmdB family regulatory protein
MPIYEYRCSECQLKFARLQPMGAGSDGITCPGCDSDRVERELSTFASSTRGAGEGAAACPTSDTCAAPT